MIEVILLLGAAFFIFRIVKGGSAEGDETKRVIRTKEALRHLEEKSEEFVVKKGIDDILAKAERLFKAEAYRNSEELYIEAVAENPKDPRPYKGLSKVYIKQQNEEDAIASLEKTCELDPTDDTSYNNLGLMYHKKKKYGKAIESYEKSLALNKDKSHRFINYALVLNEIREFGKAAESLEKAVRIEPKKETYKMLIEAYKNSGQEDRVTKVYKRLLQIEPENKEAKRELSKSQ